MKRIGTSEILTFFIIAAVLVGAGYVAFMKVQEQRHADSDAGKVFTSEAGETLYTDLDGNPFSFEDHNGKVRVVNAWATWCPFCINELPDFGEVAAAFDQEEVVFIAVNRKEDRARAKAFVETLEGVEHILFVQDPDDAFYKAIGGFSMPETVFYDPEGAISFHKRGFMTKEEIESRTQTALVPQE